ncbi:hypothetical protein SAMN05216266_1201 [Amycolatopsis marina]|uniref:Uncharacterized protein n=1 Tax=Amycolatopsis marina TaxID=490629 RepID=A0A1I1C2E0_9PSEU|nr:hypothetical protein SAMN05216266_1201 [Amycolatopsis marina]
MGIGGIEPSARWLEAKMKGDVAPEDGLVRWLVVLCGVGFPALFATGLVWHLLVAAGWTTLGASLMSLLGLTVLLGAVGLAVVTVDRDPRELRRP